MGAVAYSDTTGLIKYAIRDNPFERGWGASLAYGVSFDDGPLGGFSGEIELGGRFNKMEWTPEPAIHGNASVDVGYLTINGYYNYRPSPMVALHVGVGLGPASIRMSGMWPEYAYMWRTIDGSAGGCTAAYQFRLGASFMMASTLSTYVGYQLLGTVAIDKEVDIKSCVWRDGSHCNSFLLKDLGIANSAIEAGVRYSF